MVEIIDSLWLSQHLQDPSIITVDPRRPVDYLSGHIPGAINLPMSKILDRQTLALLSAENLSNILGQAGVNRESRIILYDEYDGQNAAMLSWVLEYLGHPNVAILSHYFKKWLEQGREVLYRPVKRQPRKFEAEPNRQVRAEWKELVGEHGEKLLDLRSEDEFRGRVATEARTGHIPRAMNLPSTSLTGQDGEFLRPGKELERVIGGLGLKPGDKVVTYCSYGPRAAIGYVALQQLGFRSVRVYDGSFHQWAQHSELLVEGEGLQIQF